MTDAASSVDAAIAAIPPKWTAWNLHSRNAGTHFIFEMRRLPDGFGGEEFTIVARGSTAAEAIRLAIAKAWIHDR